MIPARRRFDLVELLDKPILDPAGNRLGKIRRLLIDQDRGRIDYATLELDGQRPEMHLRITVPWSQIQHSADRSRLEVRIGRSTLESVATRESVNE